jgi:anti-sigma-K factor RskA
VTELDDMPDGCEAALALDFALGALDGTAMRSAELRLRSDPVFARDVARWQEQLGPLSAEVGAVAPSRSVWSTIDRELFRTAAARPVARVPAQSIWANLAIWRGLAFATSGIAAVSLGLIVARPDAVPVVAPTAVPAGSLLAASMASTDSAKAVLITATYDPTRGAVILTPAAADASRGLTPELWVIVGKNPPKSLGVIDLKDPQAHRIPGALRAQMSSGATLAISLEPAGGSPTGLPTGPVVAAGKLTTI